MVTCHDCGDVVVPIGRCQLRRCDDDGIHSLTYRCPSCGQCDAVTGLHGHEILELLDAGLRITSWQLPRETREPHFAGSPLTPDDLLDFHLLLEDDGWWSALSDS